MSLEKCRRLWGQAKYVWTDPTIEVYQNVLFDNGGLYGVSRKIIMEAAQFRSVPELHLVPEEFNPKYVTGFDPALVRTEAPDDCYYWAGFLSKHYGHFVVDTLSRLWAVGRHRPPNMRLLYWGDSADEVFSQTFSTEILGLLGLTRRDFVTFTEPTIVRSIIVPSPAFEQNHFAHDVFGRMGRQIGSSLLATGSGASRSTPVYISKARLTAGTSHVVNEQDFVDRLERAGVDAFYPELHTVSEQIRVWQSRDMIAGFLGSAMLTAAFVHKKNLLIINHEPQVYSNQVLVDRVSDNRASYFYPHGDMIDQGPNDRFHFNFWFLDPQKSAEEFLRKLDGAINGPVRGKRQEPGWGSVDPRAYIDGPLGHNVAIGKPAIQSSVLMPHSRRSTIAGEASGALSGELTGSYQIHTDMEQDPWWQVDLLQRHDLQEIRIFNRLDFGREHLGNFRILGSSDALAWTELHRVDNGAGWRIEDERPYRWVVDRPLSFRFIRIQVLGQIYMHLDQVEVFADVSDERSSLIG